MSVCVRVQISLFSGSLSLSPSFYYRVACTQSSACPAGSLSSSQDSASGVLACFPARQFEPAGSPAPGSTSTSAPRHQAGSRAQAPKRGQQALELELQAADGRGWGTSAARRQLTEGGLLLRAVNKVASPWCRTICSLNKCPLSGTGFVKVGSISVTIFGEVRTCL